MTTLLTPPAGDPRSPEEYTYDMQRDGTLYSAQLAQGPFGTDVTDKVIALLEEIEAEHPEASTQEILALATQPKERSPLYHELIAWIDAHFANEDTPDEAESLTADEEAVLNIILKNGPADTPAHDPQRTIGREADRILAAHFAPADEPLSVAEELILNGLLAREPGVPADTPIGTLPTGETIYGVWDRGGHTGVVGTRIAGKYVTADDGGYITVYMDNVVLEGASRADLVRLLQVLNAAEALFAAAHQWGGAEPVVCILEEIDDGE